MTAMRIMDQTKATVAGAATEEAIMEIGATAGKGVIQRDALRVAAQAVTQAAAMEVHLPAQEAATAAMALPKTNTQEMTMAALQMPATAAVVVVTVVIEAAVMAGETIAKAHQAGAEVLLPVQEAAALQKEEAPQVAAVKKIKHKETGIFVYAGSIINFLKQIKNEPGYKNKCN
jgi:hypothetical protein